MYERMLALLDDSKDILHVYYLTACASTDAKSVGLQLYVHFVDMHAYTLHAYYTNLRMLHRLQTVEYVICKL
jgi:hypothetical protein